MPKLHIQSQFGITPTELLNNRHISLEAKGIFAFMQSKPSGWIFSISKIAAQSKDGRDAVKSALDELEKNGYVDQIRSSSTESSYKLNEAQV